MKHKRIPALILTVTLCLGALASAASAADTDAQSQATQKSAQENRQQMKPEAQGDAEAQDGGARTKTPKAKKEEAAEPEGAVGKDAAKETALADARLTEEQAGKVRARISDSDGTAVYKVRFACDGQRYSYRIDALSGEILDKKIRADDGEKRGVRGGKGASKTDETGQTV